MQNTGAAADGKHAAITSWFWWAWNANSGDTGGIVSDQSSCNQLLCLTASDAPQGPAHLSACPALCLGNSAATHVAQVDDDWTTILWNKVDYLASVGLAPWYTQVRMHRSRHQHHLPAVVIYMP